MVRSVVNASNRRWKIVIALICWLLAVCPAWSAETEEINNGQDPTKPLMRLDLRYQYQNLPPSSDDNAHIFTLRADKPFVLAPGWSLATRLDVPLFLTEAVSRDMTGVRLAENNNQNFPDSGLERRCVIVVKKG